MIGVIIVNRKRFVNILANHKRYTPFRKEGLIDGKFGNALWY